MEGKTSNPIPAFWKGVIALCWLLAALCIYAAIVDPML